MSDSISDNLNPHSIGAESPRSVADDARLDLLLREYVADTLDGQLGRSEAAFARFIKADAMPPRRRYIGKVGIAIAATILLAAGLGLAAIERYERLRSPVTHTDPVVLQNPEFPPAESQTYVDDTVADMGTLQVDGSPFHAYRRQTIERTESFDPQTKSQLEITTPRDEIILVGLKEY